MSLGKNAQGCLYNEVIINELLPRLDVNGAKYCLFDKLYLAL